MRPRALRPWTLSRLLEGRPCGRHHQPAPTHQDCARHVVPRADTQHLVDRQCDRLLAVEWGHEPSGLRAVGCWLSVGNHYRPLMASRAAYTARVGPIPDDAVIVPKSGESSCIRPDHLWAKNKTRFHRDNQGRANVRPPGTRGGEAPALSAQSGPGADYRRSGAGGEADRERPSRPATVPLRAWVLISESACAAGHNGTSLRFHMAGGKALRRRRVSQRFLR